MPDGRPGDHPLTDIAVHGWEPFDAETNRRIRRLVNGAPGPLLLLLDNLIWNWPRLDREAGAWETVVEPERFAMAVEALEECWHELGKQA